MIKKSMRNLDYDKIYSYDIGNSLNLYKMNELQEMIEEDPEDEIVKINVKVDKDASSKLTGEEGDNDDENLVIDTDTDIDEELE